MNDPERQENVDYGDELTPEQKAAAEKTDDGPLTDEELQAALEAMNKENDDPKPENEDDPKPENEDENEGEDEDEKEDDPKIPKSRFDEAVRKERERADALQAELDSLKSRNQPPPPTDEGPTEIETQSEKVRELRAKWQDAIFDNDQSAAKGFLDQLTEAEETLHDLKLNATSARTRAMSTEDMKFDDQLTHLEEEFPVIDEKHASYDPEINRRMTRLYTGLVNSGMSRLDALKEAAQVYLEPTRKKPAKETDDTLRNKARETLKETVEKQPPEAEGKPDTKAPALTPSRLTIEQWEQLDESQQALLRGDEVT